MIDKEFVLMNDKFVGKYKLEKVVDAETFARNVAVKNEKLSIGLPYGTINIDYINSNGTESIEYEIVKPRRTIDLVFKYNEIQSIKTEDGEVEDVLDVMYKDTVLPMLHFNIKYNLLSKKVSSCYVTMLNPTLDLNNLVVDKEYKLYGLPLTNIDSSNSLCPDHNTYSGVETYIENFYTSPFNPDYVDYFLHRIPRQLFADEYMGEKPVHEQVYICLKELRNPERTWVQEGVFKVHNDIKLHENG